jgi:hypothetical protein
VYDVIKKFQQDGKTVVYCVPDSKETELINIFIQLNQKQAPQKRKAAVQTQLLSWLFLIKEQNVVLHSVPAKLRHHTRYIRFLPVTEHVILAPPPRISC